MAYTLSNMLPLGTIAPDFRLWDTVSDQQLNLQDIKGDQATVIVFSCNHCPYVHHVNEGMVQVANDYEPQGVNFIVISSNDVEAYPQDAPVHMKTFAAESGYNFPYLYDPTQEVAKAYDAACTPDFYVFDKDLKLTYRGQMDNSRPSRRSRPSEHTEVSGKDLRAAIDATVQGEPVTGLQRPGGGCGIKWK